MSLTAELLKDYEADIGTLELIPSDGGRFEVTVNGDLIYSKLKTGRHTDADEIRRLMAARSK